MNGEDRDRGKVSAPLSDGIVGYYSTAGGGAIAARFDAAFNAAFKRRDVAGPDEDPNLPPAAYASPPCFMHELDPSYLGYMPREEVLRFVARLHDGWEPGIAVVARLSEAMGGGEIAGALQGICREDMAFHDVLCCQMARLGGAPCSAMPPPAIAPAEMGDRVAAMIRTRNALVAEIGAVLPQLDDEALRQALRAIIAAHERRATEISVADALLRLGDG